MKRFSLVFLFASLPCLGADPYAAERTTVAFHTFRAKQRTDDAGALRMLANAQVRLAEATGDAREYDRAWSGLDEADRLEPGDPDTLRARARLLLSRHRFPQAFALAESRLAVDPDDAELLGVAGDAAFEMGDLTTAEARYRKLHGISARLTSWARLAQVAEARGNFAEAVSALESAMESARRRGAPAESIAWCHAVLGEVHLVSGNAREARRQYAMGLEKSPGHPLVLEHLAELEKKEGNLAASESVYRRLLGLKPDPVNRLRLAEVIAGLGRDQEAATLRQQSHREIEQAVAGGNEGYLRPLAELELEAGRFARAATHAARDLALRPTSQSRELLGRVLSTAAAAGRAVNSF